MKNETKNLFNDEIFPKKKGNNCVFLVASAILKIPNNFWPKIESPNNKQKPFGCNIFITYLA